MRFNSHRVLHHWILREHPTGSAVVVAASLVLLLFCAGAGSAIADPITVDYAGGFTVELHDTYKVVYVTRPWPGATNGFTYVLVQRGTKAPDGYPNAETITVPVRSAVTMSTTFLPPLTKLGVLDSLVGHDQTDYIYSPEVRRLVKEGKVKEVGNGSSLNVELLLKLSPDVIFVNSYGGQYDVQPKLSELGLPVVVLGDWVENTPLGTAEWIKFISLFYNREATASEVFDGIVKRYDALKRLAATADSRPTVLVNAPYQGQWTVPGGGSYVATLVHDAGGDYLWSDNDKAGSLFLDFESVYARAHDADFWINTGTWSSLHDGLVQDPRFAQFTAFEKGNVYNNNARTSATGGIDYYESGTSNPDVALRDLILIFHPEMADRVARITGDSGPLFYYQKMK